MLIKMGALGDIIQALPVAAALRQRFPQAELCWLARKRWSDILLASPCLDQVIASSNEGVAELGAQLRAKRFEVVLDMQGSPRTGMLTWLSRARWRIGYRFSLDDIGAWPSNVRLIDRRPNVHAVHRYLAFARALGAGDGPVKFPLQIEETYRQAARRLLSAAGWKGEPLAAIHAGAGRASKVWPAERFGLVAARLAGDGFLSLLVGAKGDLPLAERVIESAGVRMLNLVNRTSLRELAALFLQCRLAIGNDSGPIHLAAALGLPVAAIFGSSNPAHSTPYGDGNRCLQANLPCRPCQDWKCRQPVCLEAIRPEEVVGAVRELLAEHAAAVPGGE